VEQLPEAVGVYLKCEVSVTYWDAPLAFARLRLKASARTQHSGENSRV
jgi:hypothetical protein